MKIISELFIKQKTWFNFVSFLTQQSLVKSQLKGREGVIKSKKWADVVYGLWKAPKYELISFILNKFNGKLFKESVNH